MALALTDIADDLETTVFVDDFKALSAIGARGNAQAAHDYVSNLLPGDRFTTNLNDNELHYVVGYPIFNLDGEAVVTCSDKTMILGRDQEVFVVMWIL